MEFGEDAGMLAVYGQIVNDLVGRGMVPPYQMAAVTDNGALIGGCWSGDASALTFHETARYTPPEGVGERVAILFVDATGEPFVTCVIPQHEKTLAAFEADDVI